MCVKYFTAWRFKDLCNVGISISHKLGIFLLKVTHSNHAALLTTFILV